MLFTYASKGRRELPNDTVLLDGDAEPLGKAGQFLGQHILTPLRGVAVQVNAFNFPVWGPLEKFAPAFLAGVPTVVKPASTTAYLTARLVELIVESGLLPEGSLQLICGSVGDLFDHLTDQDLVSFTGSASTAQKLRRHPTIVGRSVRFNAEADSLNCSILGPDAGPGTAEFDLYVKQLVSEMTVKAGQKCTAIRRALVPQSLLAPVAEAAAARLAKVVVGNPADETVRMGALASLDQREEVRRSLKSLLSAGIRRVRRSGARLGRRRRRGAGRVPLTDPDHGGRRGAARTPRGRGVRSGEHADRLPRHRSRGRPRRAGHGESRRVHRHCRRRLRPRRRARRCALARPATGPGSRRRGGVHRPRLAAADARSRRPRPGRRRRGDGRHPRRDPPHAAHRHTGQPEGARRPSPNGGNPAASATVDGVHPFRKSLAELRVGDTVVKGPRTVTTEDIAHFAEFTGDTFYAHTDAEAAAANPFFDGIVAHGYLILSLAAGLFVDPDPGPVLANYGIDNLRFLTPVYPGDELTVTLTCKAITPRGDSKHGEVRWDTEVTKQDGSAGREVRRPHHGGERVARLTTAA